MFHNDSSFVLITFLICIVAACSASFIEIIRTLFPAASSCAAKTALEFTKNITTVITHAIVLLIFFINAPISVLYLICNKLFTSSFFITALKYIHLNCTIPICYPLAYFILTTLIFLPPSFQIKYPSNISFIKSTNFPVSVL